MSKALTGRKRGESREVSPHHPIRGSGERRKLPQRGPGGAPAENGFYAYFRSERTREAICMEHPFSVFLSDGGAPKRPCDSWSVGLFDVSCFMRGCSVFLYTFCVYSRKLVHVQ